MRLGPHQIRRARIENVPNARFSGSAACLAACIALLFAVALACGESGATAKPPGGPKIVSVEILELQPEFVRDEVALTGQLEAENTGAIQAEVSGVIETILFEEGQAVAKGDVLVQLKDREQRARLLEARADERLARDVFDRVNRLASENAASIARQAEVEAELDKARARVDLASLELERMRLRAPFDGVLGARMVAPGDRIEDDDMIVQILAIERLQAIFTVQEIGVPFAKVGLPVQVRVVAWPGQRFPGEVFFVSPNLDAAARRLVLKAWIENTDHRLKPGMFVNVDVEIARNDAALMVPETAVVYDRNGIYIWRAGEEGLAEKVPVTLGLRQSGRVEVVNGLGAGDRIVTAGTHKVMAGSHIQDPRSQGEEPAREELAKPEGATPEGAGGES